MSRVARCLLVAVATVTAGVAAQDPAGPAGLRIFLDCANLFCDLDFYRREVAFVDYVRDRQDADVHILISSQRTGSGREFLLTFIGLGGGAGRTDTLRFTTSDTDTEDERRRGLARTIAMGLMPFVADRPVAREIRILYGAGGPRRPPAMTQAEDDPWNYWVFRPSANASLDLEESIENYRVSGGFSANRVTEDWKINLSLRGSWRESRFELDDTTTIVNTSTDNSGRALVVRSLSDRWSFGVSGLVRQSTFLNQDLHLRFAPGIEYNVFPYSESSRRTLTFRYDLGINRFKYEEETIFLKTRETRLDHSLTLSLNMIQPWGNSTISLSGEAFVDDPAQHEIGLFGFMNIRLIRGLSLNLFGSVARIKNQIYIPNAGGTTEEILLRRRQLGTDYRVNTNIGFSYTFGSIFNNIVNPRFGGGDGPVFFF